MTHICVSKQTIIGSDNGLSPGRRQAIIWTNAGILLIRTLGTNFSEILSKIHAFSFKKMHFNMSSAKRRPFCLGLNVLWRFFLDILYTYYLTLSYFVIAILPLFNPDTETCQYIIFFAFNGGLANTLRPRQNGRHFADDIFECTFLNENVSIGIKSSLKFVPKG